MSTNFDQSGEYIKLNVGGSLFYTTIGTLKNATDSMFSAMFSGRMEVKKDSEGWVLIDRCGKHFNLILNFLRDGEIPLSDNRNELSELLIEAKFYCLENLVKSIEIKIGRLHCEDEDLTSSQATIIIVKDSRMAKVLIASTLKPVVKLTMNRYNNVFSYTSNSHDNLLRNVECLEKYALMFADTIRFVKDVSEKFENNQICEWSFHYRGYKLRSIDCMAIHYSTEKRLIKVEFHESRIHEEMLMLISVATRDLSDAELSEISKRQSGTHNQSPSITTAQMSSERDEQEAEIIRLIEKEIQCSILCTTLEDISYIREKHTRLMLQKTLNYKFTSNKIIKSNRLPMNTKPFSLANIPQKNFSGFVLLDS